MMKPFRFTLIALCTLALSSVTFAKNSPQSLDAIAVVVNDTAITQSEVNEATHAIKAQLSGSNTPLPPPAVLQKKVLDQVIDRKLQLQMAEQSGIKISDTQVDQTINNIAKENGVTAEELYAKVSTQNLTRTEYRKEIREELTLQQVQQQQVGSKITMTPDEVAKFMRSKEWQTASAVPAVNAYHIEDLIVLVPETASPQDIAAAKNQAEALAAKAKQGVSYGSLVNPNEKNIENSDLGWRKFEEIPSLFADQVAQAKKGNVIGPVQAGNGFHVIRLVDVRQEKAAPSANTMPAPTEKEAQQMVYQRKFAEALKKWVARLHGQAVINLHPESAV